jgi:transposase
MALIGIESTASYHVNLFSCLVAAGFKVILINPLQISNYVKMELRKTKTDKKDAVVIARFLLAHGDTLIQIHSSFYLGILSCYFIANDKL